LTIPSIEEGTAPTLEGNMFCEGYKVELTPKQCEQNQKSIFCLPSFPCHDCPSSISKSEPILKSTKKKVPPGMTKSVAKSLGLI
jgi:hypothetical protein